MKETEVEGIVEVLKVGRVSRTHRGPRYLTEVQRTVGGLWVVFRLPTHLTKQ